MTKTQIIEDEQLISDIVMWIDSLHVVEAVLDVPEEFGCLSLSEDSLDTDIEAYFSDRYNIFNLDPYVEYTFKYGGYKFSIYATEASFPYGFSAVEIDGDDFIENEYIPITFGFRYFDLGS